MKQSGPVTFDQVLNFTPEEIREQRSSNKTYYPESEIYKMYLIKQLMISQLEDKDIRTNHYNNHDEQKVINHRFSQTYEKEIVAHNEK